MTESDEYADGADHYHRLGVAVAEVALLVTAGLLAIVILIAEPGPWWFWTGDACPAKEGVCGVIPVGLLVVLIPPIVLLGVGIRVINCVK